MCALSGIKGRITNHSLRATSATQMYEMGVPEKIIQDHTGHRSIEALRMYERSSAQQQEAASSILSNSHTVASSHNPYTQQDITPGVPTSVLECLHPAVTCTLPQFTSEISMDVQ